MPPSPDDLQDAVLDLHQYLSDQKPPLMVVDSVEMLLQQSAAFLAAQIQAWVGSQDLSAPVSDYLYHAAKKIALMGELDLVPRKALEGYLRQLTDPLVACAPDEDQQLLRQNLERLTQAAPVVAAAGVIHRQSGPKTAEDAPTKAEQGLTREVRRLSLLLEHLRPLAAPTAPAEQRRELTSQFFTTAATQSATAQELDQRLAPLRQLGIEVATEEVFKTLARSLAGWALPLVQGQAGPVASKEQVQAMRQIVSLAEDPSEVAKRFREMVHAATEQFNEGHLGRAAIMFDLAERLIVEQKVKPMYVEPLRAQGHTALDPERLRKYAERPDYRPSLRTVMTFFNALRPAALLNDLNGEPKRERRHELLALLEAHEAPARAAAFEELTASVREGERFDPFYQMNLVYLLRVVARPESASVEDEVNVVMKVAGRSSPPPLVKQIIAYLAATRHDKAERALITYLKVFESMLLQPETAAYPAAEVEVLLDRTCAALARYGTPRAWRLLIDHGLKSEARLGSPFLRLAEAGRCDFSQSRDLVERIITALRAELPRKGMLALAAKKNEEKALALVGALAGTPLPEVQEVLKEVASGYPDRKLGQAAQKALAAVATVGKPPAPAGLSGDLELFGLPNLLQTLAQSSVSGVLSLMTADGRPQAALLFEGGRFRGGQCGPVGGEFAVYQLLERPFPGTFAFVARPDLAGEARLAPPQDVFPLLMEGVRRHDELKRASAVVPDGLRLKPTGKERTAPEDEGREFLGRVWEVAAAGKTPEECEAAAAADSFRVRRLLAHWVEEGALQEAA